MSMLNSTQIVENVDLPDEKYRLTINKILLVFGLTFLRLPRLFGLDNNAWVIILGLVPFWYVILENHLPAYKQISRKANVYFRLFVQLVIIVIVVGGILIVSILFVDIFIKQGQSKYIIISVGIAAVLSILLIIGILKFNKADVIDKRVFWAGLIYFLVVILSMFRASVRSSYDLLFVYQTLTIVIFSLSSIYKFRNQDLDYFSYVFWGLLLYLGTNFVLNLAGIENLTESYLREYQSVMLSFLGLETTRVYYPLAEGINSFGLVAGLCLVISSAYVLTGIRSNIEQFRSFIVPILGILISGFIILQTDSRGAILFSLITVVLVSFLIYIRTFSLFTAVFLSQLMVFPLMSIDLNTFKFLAPLVRNNTSTLSGRGVIWQSGLKHLSEFEWIHLIGYGMSGQLKSGVIHEYSHLFSSYLNKTDVYLHHFGLQSIFDYGYIGLIIAYALMILMGFKLLEKNKPIKRYLNGLPVLAGLIYIVFLGSVSIAPAVYAREIFYLFPFLWVSSARSKT